MRTKLVYLLLLCLFMNTCSYSDEFNKSIFRFKKVLKEKEKKSFYDAEFITNDIYVFSDFFGLHVGNLKTNKIETIIKRNIVDGFKDRDKKWGTIQDINKIDDNSFSFLNPGFIKEYKGYVICNIKTEEFKFLGWDCPPLKHQPDSVDFIKIEDKYIIEAYDPDGKYIFAEYREEDNTSFKDLYRFDMDLKNKKLLFEDLPGGTELLMLGNNLILIASGNGPIVIDYNGNVLQWYMNFGYFYGAISPDGKHAVFTDAGINSEDWTVKEKGLLLFEIDENVKKDLIEKSKELEGISDKERLKRNRILLNLKLLNSERLNRSKKVMSKNIYKVWVDVE